ncbi:hypothetical protein TNCV_2085741, partial [Trichonephila clavipes]
RFNHEWLRGTTRADDRYLSLCAQRNSTATPAELRSSLPAGSRRSVSRDDILDTYVCPYADATGDAFVLQDDNARPHRARIVDTYLEQEAIQRVPGSRQPLTKDLKEEGRFDLSTFRSVRKYFIDHAKTIVFE